MPSIADLFTMLGKKAGMDMTELDKVIAENEPLKNIEAPDVTYNTWEKSFLTVEQAKQNHEVKNHYIRQALDTVDAKISDVISEYEFDDAMKEPISKASSSYDKIKLLAGAIKQKEAAAAQALGGDKENLSKEIKKLNDQVLAERKNWENEKKQMETSFTNQKSDMKLRSDLSSYNLSKQFDRDVAIEAARIGLQKKLAEKGGQLVFENDNFRLANAKDTSLPFTINNAEVDYKAFVDQYMADSKLIQVQGTPPPTGPATAPPPAQATPSQLGAILLWIVRKPI